MSPLYTGLYQPRRRNGQDARDTAQRHEPGPLTLTLDLLLYCETKQQHLSFDDKQRESPFEPSDRYPKCSLASKETFPAMARQPLGRPRASLPRLP